MIERQFVDGAAIVEVDQQGIFRFCGGAVDIGKSGLPHQLVVDVEAGCAGAERYIHRLLIHHLGFDVRQVGGDDVVPLVVVDVQRRRAIGRGDRAQQAGAAAHIEDHLALGIDRHGGGTGQRKIKGQAAIVFLGVLRWNGAAGGGVGGVEAKVDLGLARFLLVVPEILKQGLQVAVIGPGATGLSDQAAIHQRLISADSDGVEAGIRSPVQQGVVELQAGGGHLGDEAGGTAGCADQSIGGHPVAGQEVVHPLHGGAGLEIGDLQGIAIEASAAIAAKGGGVGAIGHDGPGVAIDRTAVGAGGDAGDQAPPEGILVADLINHEAGTQQPALGQLSLGDRRLAEGEQAGTVAIAGFRNAGPELNRVRAARHTANGAAGRHGRRRQKGVEAADAGAEHASAINVFNRRIAVDRQRTGDIEIEAGAGGAADRRRRVADAADVVVADAALPLVHLQIDVGVGGEHGLLVGHGHVLAPGDDRLLLQIAGGIQHRHAADAEIRDTDTHGIGGGPGDRLRCLEALAGGIKQGRFDHRGGLAALRRFREGSQTLDGGDRGFTPGEQHLEVIGRAARHQGDIEIVDDRVIGGDVVEGIGLPTTSGFNREGNLLIAEVIVVEALIILGAAAAAVGHRPIDHLHPGDQIASLKIDGFETGGAGQFGGYGQARQRELLFFGFPGE